MLRLLAVTAHPDDEAGCFGGSLRLYAERGVETAVICLTPGQAARNRDKAKDDHDLAAMRRKEFAEACTILRVSRPVVLDYPDGQLHRIDMRFPVGDLVRPAGDADYGAGGSNYRAHRPFDGRCFRHPGVSLGRTK